MVKRRALEHPIRFRVLVTVSALAVLEHRALQDHRRGLGDEDAAHNEQQKLGLEEDRHRTERATERKRTGVAHEDLGGVTVVPEEANARAEDGRTEDRQ